MEVWIIEASQGQWSDKCDWIVEVFDSEEAMLQYMPKLEKNIRGMYTYVQKCDPEYEYHDDINYYGNPYKVLTKLV